MRVIYKKGIKSTGILSRILNKILLWFPSWRLVCVVCILEISTFHLLFPYEQLTVTSLLVQKHTKNCNARRARLYSPVCSNSGLDRNVSVRHITTTLAISSQVFRPFRLRFFGHLVSDFSAISSPVFQPSCLRFFDHLVSGFSWFPWVLEQMLGWFPTVPSCLFSSHVALHN